MKRQFYILMTGFLLLGGCSGETEPIDTPVIDLGTDMTPDVTTTDDVGIDTTPDATPDMKEPLQYDLSSGNPCELDEQCTGGTCLIGEGYENGFCTQLDCVEDCGPSEICVESPIGTICAQTCLTNDNCGENQACGSVTNRDPAPICLPVIASPDGATCSEDEDCQSGRCRGGSCRNRCLFDSDCFSFGERESACFEVQPGRGICIQTCEDVSQCEEGEVCQPLTFDVSICGTDDTRPIDESVLTNSVFDFSCVVPNGETTLPFEVAAGTTSYQFTPLNLDGSDIAPKRIGLPSGGIIDFATTNLIQTIPSLIYGGMNPTVVPAHNGLLGQLESGSHTYVVESNADQLCHYFLEESAPGDTIDVNFYFVGVPGLDANLAPTHVEFQRALTEFGVIFEPAGYTVGQVRYFDVSPEAAALYAVPQSDRDIIELVSLSTPPGTTIDDALSINVFFVQSFGIAGGAIGISEGLPGPAGLHGTHGSGVAFTSEFLGQQSTDGITGQPIDGTELTAQVMAHEVGHYLGLFHTSEQTGNSHDPLQDTPQCTQISASCPDLTNLMFPFAGVSHVELTPQQAFVLGAHPLTKTGVVQ